MIFRTARLALNIFSLNFWGWDFWFKIVVSSLNIKQFEAQQFICLTHVFFIPSSLLSLSVSQSLWLVCISFYLYVSLPPKLRFPGSLVNLYQITWGSAPAETKRWQSTEASLITTDKWSRQSRGFFVCFSSLHNILWEESSWLVKVR